MTKTQPKHGHATCPTCGNYFAKRAPNQKYCHRRCNPNIHNTPLEKQLFYLKVCEQCSRYLVSRFRQARFCSKLCRERPEHMPESKLSICDYCEGKFVPKKPHQRFCCPECQKLDYKEAYQNIRFHRGGAELEYSRRCNTCGTPTDNCWCDECRKKRKGDEEEEVLGELDFGMEINL